MERSHRCGRTNWFAFPLAGWDVVVGVGQEAPALGGGLPKVDGHDGVVGAEDLVEQRAHPVDVVAPHLDEDGSGWSEQVPGGGETIPQVAQVRVHAVPPRVPEDPTGLVCPIRCECGRRWFSGGVAALGFVLCNTVWSRLPRALTRPG